MVSNVIKFGAFTVTSQVFYQTSLSYALVNLKPLVPGHVLVCTKRPVARITMMNSEEVQDFYTTVHKISKVIENYYKADAMNISIQDGPLAGQSVSHVHCHIIPRKLDDLPNVDDIYRLLDGQEGDLEHAFRTIKHNRAQQALGADNENREPRSMSDMAEEARVLADFMKNNAQ